MTEKLLHSRPLNRRGAFGNTFAIPFGELEALANVGSVRVTRIEVDMLNSEYRVYGIEIGEEA